MRLRQNSSRSNQLNQINSYQTKLRPKQRERSVGFRCGDHDAQLDFAGVDHLHIDLMIAKRAEDATSDVGVTAQADASNCELTDVTLGRQCGAWIGFQDFAQEQ